MSAAEAPTVIELSPDDVRREQLERKEVRPGERKADVLLKVTGLSTHFFTPDGVIQAVDDVSFELGYGETLGLVGESGCGKSVTALSIARLVPDPPGRIVAGEIVFDGIDVLKLSQDDVRKLRGSEIGFIFQDPLTSLNPTLTIGQGMIYMRTDQPPFNDVKVRRAVALHLTGNPPIWDKTRHTFPAAEAARFGIDLHVT